MQQFEGVALPQITTAIATAECRIYGALNGIFDVIATVITTVKSLVWQLVYVTTNSRYGAVKADFVTTIVTRIVIAINEAELKQ